MTLAQRLSLLAAAIGGEIKSLENKTDYANLGFLWMPQGSVLGAAVTALGTASNVALAVTSRQTATKRTRYASAATANSGAGIRTTTPLCWRGNASGLGGFRLVMRWTQSTNLTGSRAFFGLAATNAALTGDASALVNCLGIGFDAADANTGVWSIIANDATGVATKIATAQTRDTTSLLELTLEATRFDNKIFLTFKNLSTGVTHNNAQEVSLDLLANTVFLNVHMQQHNGALTSAVQPELVYAAVTLP